MPQILDFSLSRKIQFPIFSFNFNDQFDLQAIVAALVKTQTPGILMLSSAAIEFSGLTYAANLFAAAKSTANTSLYLQLDHCRDLDLISTCAKLNFDIIMADFSYEEFETNISLTKQAAAIAHKHGVLVEGELGTVPTVRSPLQLARAKAELTDPGAAIEFVRRTEVDLLAVSVGNVHGTLRDKPKLDFNLITQLARRLHVPLVLHGTDFLHPDLVRQALAAGIQKANFGPELREVYRRSLCDACKKRTVLLDQRPILAFARRSIERHVLESLSMLKQ